MTKTHNRIDNNNKINEYLENISSCIINEDFLGAEKLCISLLSLDPSHSRALEILGDLHETQGRLEDAEQSFKNAIKYSGANADTCFKLANVLSKQEKLNEAIPHLRKVIELEPSHDNAHWCLAHALAIEGKFREAYPAFMDFYRIAPGVKASLDIGSKVNEIPVILKFNSIKDDDFSISSIDDFKGDRQEGETNNSLDWPICLHILSVSKASSNFDKCLVGFGAFMVEKAEFLMGSEEAINAILAFKGPDFLAGIFDAAARLGYTTTGNFIYGPEIFSKRQNENREAGLNYVLINAIQRSGSTFLARSLRPAFGETGMHKITIGFFPKISLIPEKVRQLSLGGVLCKDHFLPTRENLDLLHSAGVDRIFLLIRDPRQSLLSWVYLFEKLFFHSDTPNSTAAYAFEVPSDYATWTLRDKIDFHIRTYYPSLVEFLEGWREVDTNDPWFATTFCEFGELKERPSDAIRRLCDFFDVPAEFAVIPKIDDKWKENGDFRKGEYNEWSNVFTADQKKRTGLAIPKYFMDHYGWLG